jgi:homoserine O-acetyltransferase/O-succinyltransferase
MQVYRHQQPVAVESGEILQELEIAYQTWGQLNEKRDNVIWICHALTASSAAQDWWPGLIGDGLPFNTATYFIVCDNILGSCYGTTGPGSINPATGNLYGTTFPFITIKDMVLAHEMLRQHLGISKIQLLVGGSMGGYQALEWVLMRPSLVDRLFLLATSPRESAWGIAIHTAQRMAIELDPTWNESMPAAGSKGIQVARAIGMLTYRSYASFVHQQTDENKEKTDNFKASSYIHYQGSKLAARFNAHSYWILTKAMDSHNIARGRQDIPNALQSIRTKTLIIGITSDLLCPLQEQKTMAEHIPGATFVAIDSIYGHDGFLVETGAISHHLSAWLKQ